MSLNIAVLKEIAAFEKRIAASPESIKKLTTLGCTILVESGAGIGAALTDAELKSAGAKIVKSATEATKNADIILKVQPPSESEIKSYKKGALLLCMLDPYNNGKTITALGKAGIQAFAMELVPRITRAQSMDVLSSQSNLAGYKAVLDAAEQYGRAFPMMMTAAGTVPPAKVFVMGAGVAGLQAIATAKRLGAIVTATDVRPAAKEQVESLGGSFVAVEDDEFKKAETAGGYAKEMSKTYQKKQEKLVEDHIAKQDIVITTALIPGRPAPKLITEAMVKSMKPGSVIVDLAVESGGNCEPSEPGKIIDKNGVSVIGHRNVPSRLAASASLLYAKNLLNLLGILIDKDSGKLVIDWNDEIIQGMALTKGGKIIHPNFKSSKKPAAKKKATTKTTAKKTTVKKAAPKTQKKAPAKKPSAKTSTKKKTAPAKKPASKKPATKKPVAKKTTAKKAAAQ